VRIGNEAADFALAMIQGELAEMAASRHSVSRRFTPDVAALIRLRATIYPVGWARS
jgi:hypothetical protein